MRTHSMAPWIPVALLAACAETQPVDDLSVLDPATGGSGAENAAMEVDRIRKEYDECIRKRGPGQPSCQELRWMYEDARQHFDAAARKTAP